MRVVKGSEVEHTCTKCKSIIAMFPHEIDTVGPPGPYDIDCDPIKVGMQYWMCPVCKNTNWIMPSTDDSEY